MTAKADTPPDSLFAALVQLQAELPHVGKDKTARVVTKEKGTYTYDYANLASVTAALRPLMGPLGLAFTSKPTIVIRDGGEREFVLAYKLVHAPSGEIDAGEYSLPDPSRTTPQQIGSAITYARRYCLCAVTGVAPDDDDDDGQAAAAAKPKRASRARGTEPQQDARAQRNRPPETRADGSATQAELERMRSGPEPGTWRSNGTAENDPFYDQPPGQLPGPPFPPGSRQIGALQGHFRRLGLGDEHDRDERLGITAKIAGFDGELGSSQELSQEQVQRALKVLEKCRDRPQLTDAVAQLLEKEDAGA